MGKNILIEPHYWGSVAFFKSLVQAKEVTLDLHSNYQKGSYRNRCHIMSPNKMLVLSIPLAKGKYQRSAFHEVGVSYSENWQKDHWQSLVSSYRRSPYFEFYEDDIYPLYKERKQSLQDFNVATVELVIQMLKLDIGLKFTEKFIPFGEFEGEDLRDKIHPNSQKNLVKHSFESYHQVFMDRMDFMPNLSILDLIFNLGPRSPEYLSH